MNTSLSPSSVSRAACLNVFTSFSPPAMTTLPFVFDKKAFILSKSAAVSSAPDLTHRVSPAAERLPLKAVLFSCVLVTSEITFPSFSSITLSPYSSANSRSCETTMTSFDFDSFFRVSNTCLPVAESSAPVGSSAMMISGLLTRARAMAIRCFCPPDRVLGLRLA